MEASYVPTCQRQLVLLRAVSQRDVSLVANSLEAALRAHPSTESGIDYRAVAGHMLGAR